MLILTRKVGQGFHVGDGVEITITEISGDKVRVGINAPREVKVLRSELTQTMEHNLQATHKASAQSLKALAQGLGRVKAPGAAAPPLTQAVHKPPKA